MDIKNFISAIAQIAEEKDISTEKVLETIEMAIAAAYKKDYGKKGQIIKAKLDPESGDVKFWQVKLIIDKDMIYSESELLEEAKVEKSAKKSFSSFIESSDSGTKMKKRFISSTVSSLTRQTMSSSTEALGKMKEKREGEESKLSSSPVASTREGEEAAFAKASASQEKVRFNPEKHITLEEAKKIDPKIEVGQELEIPLETKEDYGRIAAQTAKQVILQRIREAEKESVFADYKSKEGEIISGIVQRIEGRNIFLDIGKTLGILPKEEQVPGEFYRPGQRLKTYLLKVEETPRGPTIILSRAYPKLISKLFELEVPEISSGQVQIKAIAREPGSRSKVSVSANMEGVDPIGSMVGQKGTRVMAVINELAGEKIDIIEYSPEAEKYIANSLSPAKVLEVKIMPKNKAEVFVPEDQLSLAIGKDGQNVRLAAKLTGWKIDIRQPYEEKEEEEEREEKEEGEEKEEKIEVYPVKSSKGGISSKTKLFNGVKKETKKKKTTKTG